MAYSDFTFTKLYQKYQLEQQSIHLFDRKNPPLVLPSESLLRDIEMAQEMPLYSEKAKSEAIIFPIIRELKKNNKHISIFSGYAFNIETDKELSGAPDFMISAKPAIIEPQKPIFCLVESKNRAIEEGFAQCAAEMYAARLFNQQMGEKEDIVFGTVTNAFDWTFLKLQGNYVYVDINRYYLNELPAILGILQSIIANYKA